MREKTAQRHYDHTASEKTWTIPGVEGHRPVTLSLRIPEVTITDGEDRYIVVAPGQSTALASTLDAIADWLTHGDHDVAPAQDDE